MTEDSLPRTAEPDSVPAFRMAQLLLLLQVADELSIPIGTIDKLAVLDFMAANPYIALDPSRKDAATTRTTLRLAGFSDRQLSYNAVGQRFVTRRQRLLSDVAALVAYRMIRLEGGGFRLSDRGANFADGMSSMYSVDYRTSADVILRRFGRSSQAKLDRLMREQLGDTWLLLDLLADIDASASSVSDGERRGAP